MLDTRIINAKIIDGTGNAAYHGSVGIRNGKLVLGQAAEEEEAAIQVDAAGKTLCPGFIDSHSHSDLYIGSDPETVSLCKISQGITTQVGGQCGSSLFPAPLKKKVQMLEYLFGDVNQEQLDAVEAFQSFAGYVNYAKSLQLPGNFAFLSGHSTLRMATVGYENRPATKEELEEMKRYLREAMERGCFGLSSGLIYVPGVYAPTEELIELCKVMRPYGGIYATHMRSEADHVVEGVKEAIQIAEEAGVSLVISHHKVCGPRNWGVSEETLRLVHEAIARGVSVTLDQYPYTASQTGLCQCMSPKYFTNGPVAAAALLKDPKMREKICKEMTEVPCSYNSSYQNAGGFDGILILSVPHTPQAVGMTVSEWAKKCGKDPFEAYFDLMEENECAGSGAFSCMQEEEVERIYLDENTVAGTDGLVHKKDGVAHPRAYGAVVRSISEFACKKHLVSMEQAVRKATGLTAERWGLSGKGKIADGYDADLVLLSEEKLSDQADFLHPSRLCSGIHTVWVNGAVVYQDGKMTGVYPGKVLLHEGK